MSAPPYAIGSDHFPGLSKVTEEIGELGQVLGKILGIGHDGDHWDGTNLRQRTQEEMGDVVAAIRFYARVNRLSETEIDRRAAEKLRLFNKWHEEQR